MAVETGEKYRVDIFLWAALSELESLDVRNVGGGGLKDRLDALNSFLSPPTQALDVYSIPSTEQG